MTNPTTPSPGDRAPRKGQGKSLMLEVIENFRAPSPGQQVATDPMAAFVTEADRVKYAAEQKAKGSNSDGDSTSPLSSAGASLLSSAARMQQKKPSDDPMSSLVTEAEREQQAAESAARRIRDASIARMRAQRNRGPGLTR